MSSTLENKILNLQERLKAENKQRDKEKNDTSPSTESASAIPTNQTSTAISSPNPINRRPRQLGDMGTPTRSRKQLDLPVSQFQPMRRHDSEFEAKVQEIMKVNGILSINGVKYTTLMDDLEHMGELGNGTCGHVVKMRHKASRQIIAVKQMRRSGNTEENKRIIMDIDVVLKSHDCPYIVKCLGCFITESDVWICMELMTTCLDKLLKRVRKPIPEEFLGKVTLATVKALSYLKEKHGVIHRDVKPSNILLDENGNVKLCDFGISGRLVDSKAKTRSAGCAAYMAPERIDPPDPTKPDYDIRADVWSLGITLVELATGVFPYQDCKTDFEVLSRVVQDDPPSLPLDKSFTKEFRSFVGLCLTKNYKHRPKYNKLMEHPFIQMYEAQQKIHSNLPSPDCQWFCKVMRQLEPRPAEPSQKLQPQRPVTGHVSLKQTLRSNSAVSPSSSKLNSIGSSNAKDYRQNSIPTSSNNSDSHVNNNYGNTYGYYSPYALRRRDYFRSYSPASVKYLGDSNFGLQRSYSPYRQALEQQQQQQNGQLPKHHHQDRPHSPYCNSLTESSSKPLHHHYHQRSYSPAAYYENSRENSVERWHMGAPRSLSPFTRDYSPWRRENVDPPGVVQIPTNLGKYNSQSHAQQQQYSGQSSPRSKGPEQKGFNSPSSDRNRFPPEPAPQGSGCNSTSPLYASRFAHQLKQENSVSGSTTQVQLNNKESAKKRFASYVRLRFGSERTASPEPPPRLNRGESPFFKRAFGEQASPLFPRRYVSPSPPIPPPRRLSESSSVPASPQHNLYSRLHFTPELQRRIP